MTGKTANKAIIKPVVSRCTSLALYISQFAEDKLRNKKAKMIHAVTVAKSRFNRG
jgi:hypothetical protein